MKTHFPNSAKAAEQKEIALDASYTQAARPSVPGHFIAGPRGGRLRRMEIKVDRPALGYTDA